MTVRLVPPGGRIEVGGRHRGVELSAPSSFAFVDDFERANGSLGNGWLGSTWAIVSGKAVNTPSLGSALNANSGFGADTDWNKGTGWTIGSGKASHSTTGSIDILSQVILTAARWYRCDWTITDYTSGSLAFRAGAAANISNTRAAVGTYVNTLRADNTTAAIRGATSTVASVDDVTFKLIALADLFAVQDARTPYGEMNAIWDIAAGTQYGVVMCVDDPANPQNLVIAYQDGNNFIKLDKCVGGVYTNLVNVSTTAVTGKNIRLYRAPGTNTFQVFYGSAGSEIQIGTDQTISDAGIISNTKHGILATTNAVACQAASFGAYTIPPWTYIGDVLTATVAGDQSNVYEANVIYEANAQVLTGTVFKMWYTSGWGTPILNYAESADGITWSKYGSNPILSAHYRSMVVKSGSTYYHYTAQSGHTEIDLYTSTDGVTLSLDTNAALPLGSGGAWDDNAVANCHVWVEAVGDWRMLYEAKQSGGSWSIGYATSTDGKVWSKSVSNPVISGAGGRGGPWVTKISGTYHLWAHYSIGGVTTLPTDIYHWTSSDCITWTLAKPWPLLYRRDAFEGARTAVGQCADVFIVEVNGIMYAFYSASADGSQQSGAQRIRLATAPASYIAGV